MSHSEPLRQLLHFRMRVGVALSVVGTTTFTIRNIVDPVARAKSSLLTLGLLVGIAMTSLVLFFVLNRYRQLVLPRLRQIEASMVALIVALLMVVGFDWFDRGAQFSEHEAPDLAGPLARKIWAILPNGELVMDRAYRGLAGMMNVSFSLVAVGYGVLIPNTWRRCLVVMVILVVAAEVCLIRAGFLYPALRAQLPNFMFIVFYNVSTFGAIGLYGCYKLTVLRQEAEEAREVGPYVLQERLGQGGMGEVYQARHRLLRRPCAVKLIRANQAGSSMMLARFEREVQSTAELSHPNTIEIYDYGRTDDGTLYYAMEYLPGANLEALVRRYGRLPPGRVIYLLRQVCRALREAHGRGLVHRDIKPGNIFVTERGGEYDVVKLLDFGLVAHHGRAEGAASGEDPGTADTTAPPLSEDQITMAGHILGTPAFMSPEQAMGAAVDARSDIYCLGAVAFFVLTGMPVYDRGNSAAMIDAHRNATPRRPSELIDTIPPDLDEVVWRCLAKLPAARYESAAALEAALGRCRSVADWNARCGEQWWKATQSTNRVVPEPGSEGDTSGQDITASHDPQAGMAETAEPGPEKPS